MNPFPTSIRASVLALSLPSLAAAGYIWVSCERFAQQPGQCAAQWAQGGAMVMTAAGWVMGYWQPNQAIREREKELLLTTPPAPAGPGPLPPQPDGFQLPDLPLQQLWEAPELARLTVPKLREIAQAMGLPASIYNGRKDELIAALTGTAKAES